MQTKKLKKQHKFLKSLSLDSSSASWRRQQQRRVRNKRSGESGEEDGSSQPVESVLSEIAKDEIEEVDIIMEDISDEIKDLQVGS